MDHSRAQRCCLRIRNLYSSCCLFISIALFLIIRRIPKEARFEACKELTKMVLSINKAETVQNWLRLFYFAPNCFAIPNKSKRNSPSMATIVKRNVLVYSKCAMPTYPQGLKRTTGSKKVPFEHSNNQNLYKIAIS